MTTLQTYGPGVGRFQNLSFVVGVVCLALCGVGAYADPEQFYRSYLVAYLYWIGLALGCVAVVMLHHLTGGRWGQVIRRLLESGTQTLGVMLLFTLPLLFGLRHLYLWARPQAVAADEMLMHKSLYLNVPFFLARMAFYFAAWLLLAHFLNKWSNQQDRSGSHSWTRRLRSLSGPGLVLYALTVTFASVDLVMSLEPHWFSTIYGMMFIVGQVLTALAFAVVALSLLARRTELGGILKPSDLHDLGNLTLAFVMLWAYVAFSQFLIIWSGNLPEETPWYVRRLNGGWGWIAAFLVLFHFFLPFFLLLVRENKRRIGALAGIAGAMIVIRWADLFWVIAPAFHKEQLQVHWMDLVAPIGIGGVWVAVFLRKLRERPLLPVDVAQLDGGLAS